MPQSNFSQIALVLQGGGALGAYQAGVYEALSRHRYEPDWFAGISIGGINAAIMAGNRPADRVPRLRQFWEEITSRYAFPAPQRIAEMRSFFNAEVAGLVATFGVPGFFEPRVPPAIFYPQGFPEALSVYDTRPLADTLKKLVDFDLINARACRLSLGAVHIKTGNFVYFDNYKQRIGVEHVMASGALPPGLPPVEIEGELYWDGGLVSNTPLTTVLDSGPDRDTLIFQVDLFSSRGPLPRDLFEAEERRKDIIYSSRTRLNTDVFKATYALRRAIRELHALVPAERRDDPDIRAFKAQGESHRVAIVHLIYRRKPYEGQVKDYEFSRASMLDHWNAGLQDAQVTLADGRWNEPVPDDDGIRVYDLTQHKGFAAGEDLLP